LICFPYAGGGAAAYAHWPEALAAHGLNVDVRPVRLPGRDDRVGEPRFTDLAALAEHVDAEWDHELVGRYVLYGHSMGALIAHALTLRRQRRGAPLPLALVLSAHRAPHVPPNRTLDPGLDDDQLAERLVAIGGIPPLLRHRRTFMASLLPLVRDDLRVCSGTVALHETDAVGVPMYIFAGLNDIVAPPAHVAAWADHAGAGAWTYALPGGHLFIQSHAKPFLAALAAVLRRHQPAPAGSRP
jgi:surfactin synthase thioesterase subunit